MAAWCTSTRSISNRSPSRRPASATRRLEHGDAGRRVGRHHHGDGSRRKIDCLKGLPCKAGGGDVFRTAWWRDVNRAIRRAPWSERNRSARRSDHRGRGIARRLRGRSRRPNRTVDRRAQARRSSRPSGPWRRQRPTELRAVVARAVSPDNFFCQETSNLSPIDVQILHGGCSANEKADCSDTTNELTGGQTNGQEETRHQEEGHPQEGHPEENKEEIGRSCRPGVSGGQIRAIGTKTRPAPSPASFA